MFLVMAQSLISNTLQQEESLIRIQSIMAEESFASRHALGKRICTEFQFFDATGRVQLAGCLKALSNLASHQKIQLPERRRAPIANRPRLLEGEIAIAPHLPTRLAELRPVELIVVTEKERPVWNTLIDREHPQGMTTFAGCQLRYLVRSVHGWLGAVGFSASALRVKARDRWMAWTESQRQENLHLVVCLSRFLIRPAVRCPHLASHVLGLALRRLPRDFESRYQFGPLMVESYADQGVAGTCLRAANFVGVGKTAGRGRQDRYKRFDKTIKTVYLYPLKADWRKRLGVPWVDQVPELLPGEGLNSEQWAENEFGGAPLGDKRLSARLVNSAQLMMQHIGHKINAGNPGDSSAIDGFYRLIEKPAESEVTVENILMPHRERSLARLRAQRVVLAIQDGTDLNFTTRPGCDGLQIVGKNQTGVTALGLHLHATMAVTDQGLPLGMLRLGFDSQTENAASIKKKTRRWLEAHQDLAQDLREVGGKTQVISVCDREADFFELFHNQRRYPRVELLVRAHHNRNLEKKDAKLFAEMSSGAADGNLDIEIEGLTLRPKSSRKKARPARRKRLANCELRFRSLSLPPTIKQAAPVKLSAVHLVETCPPEDETPVQWFLLTTAKVKDPETAAKIVGYYLQRWRIEDYFRILKTGCKVESLLFRTAERLQRAIAINAVIAWRIMVMTLLGRQVPDCDPEVMFSNEELNFLRDYAKKQKSPAPAQLGQAVKLVAQLGGYRARKHDHEPGSQIMWTGFNRLTSAALGHAIGFEAGKHYALNQPD